MKFFDHFYVKIGKINTFLTRFLVTCITNFVGDLTRFILDTACHTFPPMKIMGWPARDPLCKDAIISKRLVELINALKLP